MDGMKHFRSFGIGLKITVNKCRNEVPNSKSSEQTIILHSTEMSHVTR